MKMCYIDKTSINAADVAVSTDGHSVHALSLFYNKNIHHLPIRVREK